MTDKKTPADLYECHCDHCGDRFWIPPPDAEEIECPTCKKMTPLIVLRTACKETSFGQYACPSLAQPLTRLRGIEEKHTPGTFVFFPCPYCDEGKADFVSEEARKQHLKDYHKIDVVSGD